VNGSTPTPPASPTPARTPLSPLQQIRHAAQALLAQGKVDETWDFFLAALEAVLVKNRDLELLLTKLRRARIGRHSERLDPGQIALLFDALVGQGGDGTAVDRDTEAHEDAALDREIAEAEHAHPRTSRGPRKTRKHGPGWQTRGVQRQVHAVEVPRADRACATCHGRWIGSAST
jgi:hypothetical protein